MAALEPSGPNAEQIKYWNDLAGPRWAAQAEMLDRQIGPLGERTMERAGFAAGERVLDVGCGCGSTAIEIARRVGPSGRVVGIDLASPMLDVAREAVRRAGAANVDLLNADAQTHRFAPASFDVLFSRFGVMFFADPRAAFANLREALRLGGRLAFLCWQALPLNPWMAVPLAAVLQHVAPPAPPEPGAPGPFAFADSGRVRGLLEGAGFAGVAFESLNEKLSVAGGHDLDAAVDVLLQLGPAAALLRDASEDVRVKIAPAVRTALAPYFTPGDGLRMDSAAWIVTAQRP